MTVDIAEGYRSLRSEGASVELERRRAIQQIIGKAEPGDTVLIAGKGHETGQQFATDTIPFDDRIVAAEEIRLMMAAGI